MKTSVVTEMPMERVVSVNGTLAADEEATISAKVAARVASRLLAYLRWKRSTRPPVSISFCLPV